MPLNLSQHHRSPNRIGVGVDFGTSNSSVALFDGNELHCLEFKEEEQEFKLIPTAIYISKDLLPTIGRAGIEQYLDDNRNRQIHLKREYVGDIDMTLGILGAEGDAETFTVRTNAWTDQDLPGRLICGIKSWLGNGDIDRVKIFEKSFSLTALVTPILLKLKETYTAVSNDIPNVHFGRPVNFVGSSLEANERALSRLKDACLYAEIINPVFYEEPVAAAMSFLHTHTVETGSKYLVFDFGGGTLDLTVLEVEKNGFNVLATGGISLGGNKIDGMIYEKKIFPEIGRGVKTYRNDASRQEKVEFRFDDYAELLTNWQNAYQLNTPVLRNQVAFGMEQGGETAVKLKRLRSIIVNNLSYEVLRAIETAKIELSKKSSTVISIPQVDLNVPFSRQEFEQILETPMNEISTVIAQELSKAGIDKKELNGVVCTGGSSEMPAVRSHLETLLGVPIIQHDSFTGIAAGLAIANYFGYEQGDEVSELGRGEKGSNVEFKYQENE